MHEVPASPEVVAGPKIRFLLNPTFEILIAGWGR
jgi:hypothetical protein